jgi:GDPmannose 4,6-dehydratase
MVSFAKDSGAAVEAAQGKLMQLRLGNLAAAVDWGHAEDAVRAMSLMLQQHDPADYVVGTGTLHTVKDWLDEAFGQLNVDWRPFVFEDRSILGSKQSSAVLCGDSSRIRSAGWVPNFNFTGLVYDMVQSAHIAQKRVTFAH